MTVTNDNEQYTVAVNAGSSSIKLALFTVDEMRKVFVAAVENIGQPTAQLITTDGNNPIIVHNHTEAAVLLLEQLQAFTEHAAIMAVGHRIVHGGPRHFETQLVTDEVLKDLHELAVFDPEHLPVEVDLIVLFQQTFPEAHHVLCFDTAFHHDLPTRSRFLSIPRHFEAQGIRRYGFHGLSYAYVMDELRRVEGEAAANGNVIIAHLGSGASLVALQGGRPVDTTMSMTPTSGIPMSTRSGDLDPGLMFYLARTQGYDLDKLHHMVNFESGLLGISETTSDMERLLEIEDSDRRAKDAVDIFCYNVTKVIGGFAAALGELNTLVFTGGMGENAPKIRVRICEQLAFMGVKLDASRNQKSERLISVDGGLVGVHVIHTDEAATIAREVRHVLDI